MEGDSRLDSVDSEASDGTVCDYVYRTVKPVTALCLQDSEACDRTVCDCVYRTVQPVMVLCVTVFKGQ